MKKKRIWVGEQMRGSEHSPPFLELGHHSSIFRDGTDGRPRVSIDQLSPSMDPEHLPLGCIILSSLVLCVFVLNRWLDGSVWRTKADNTTLILVVLFRRFTRLSRACKVGSSEAHGHPHQEFTHHVSAHYSQPISSYLSIDNYHLFIIRQ